MLAADERADPAHVRRGEAVARRAHRRAARPRDLDVHAAGEELDRRARVVEERQRVALLVAADREDGREAPRIALDRQVMRRGDEHGTAGVRAVCPGVQDGGGLPPRPREAGGYYV